MKRLCVICGARVRNINQKVKTCSSDCTAKLHRKRPEPEPPVQCCQHCGTPTSEDEGTVCNACYSQYTPAMLCDMDQ